MEIRSDKSRGVEMEGRFAVLQVAECIQNGGEDVVGRNTRLGIASVRRKWITSLDIRDFGLARDTNILLGEGVGGNWTSQSGGSG
jgi:hypothetical protein